MNINYFAIQCISEPDLLWSNDGGWTEGENFDLFTSDEIKFFNLPLNGQWVKFF